MNLAAAGALVWPAVIAYPFVWMESAWALVLGALSFAAARRIAGAGSRWLLGLIGATTTAWGIYVTIEGKLPKLEISLSYPWLMACALTVGVLVVVAAFLLKLQHQKTSRAGAELPHSELQRPKGERRP